MQTKITSLSDLHAQRRPVVTLDTLRLDAKRTNRPQVICHADDASFWFVVTPGGACLGLSVANKWSATDAEENAAYWAGVRGWGAPCVRMDEVGR